MPAVFVTKEWHDLPQTDTPLDAAGLDDFEERVLAGVIGAGGAWTSVSASYAVQSSDSAVAVDSSGGPVTVTLPAAASRAAGARITVKDSKGQAAQQNITIVPAGADTIDRAPSKVIVSAFGGYSLICDGVSNWEVVA